MSVTVIDHTEGDKKPLTHKQRLLIVADNLEGYWGPLAADKEPVDKENIRLAREDAQTVREIAERLP